MSKNISLVLLLVALVGLVACVRVYWGGDQGLMFVWKTQPSFTDTFVYMPEVTALTKEDLVKDHPGIWEELVVMDIVNEEQEAKLAQIRHKRMHRLAKSKSKSGKVADTAKKPAEAAKKGKTSSAIPAEKPAAKTAKVDTKTKQN